MKKRYHTNQKNNRFSLNSSYSNRVKSGYLGGTSRGISRKLANEAKSEGGLAQNAIVPLSNWRKEEEDEMKLEDELTVNELNGFAFSCIVSLANLAAKGNSGSVHSVDEVITQLVDTELMTYAELVKESKAAKIEFKEYAAWSKEFITSVQPLLSASTGPTQEVGQLTKQVMQCAERCMCQKHRAEVLSKRVDFLVGAIACYVGKVGTEMGFPEALMGKVAASVKRILLREKAVAQ